jgi:uncharacterized membrane protein
MLSGGLLPRVGAYAVLALGFWLLFQAFENSNILSGIVGGALVIVGMYLMSGVWRDMFAKFGGNYKLRKENDSSDDTAENRTRRTGSGDISDGSDQGG